MAKKENRCWPRYEPVKGKSPYEQGSCRPKSESKLTGSQRDFRNARAKQLDDWKAEHPQSPKKAAQHLQKPQTGKSGSVRKRTPKAKTTD